MKESLIFLLYHRTCRSKRDVTSRATETQTQLMIQLNSQTQAPQKHNLRRRKKLDNFLSTFNERNLNNS